MAARQGSYVTRLSEFKFIAPRCLDAPDQRGVHVGTLAREPTVYCGGATRPILRGEPFWPRRVAAWDGAPERPVSPRFERFHVYDIVESTEYASADPRFPNGTVVTLLGLSACGKRVAVHVYGVRHYFFLGKAEADAALGVTSAEQLARAPSAAAARGPRLGPADVDARVVDAAPVYYYDAPRRPFYRVSSNSGRLVAHLRETVCAGLVTHEAGVDATTRLLLDHDLPSFGWYRLRPGPAGERVVLRHQRLTSSDVEVNCTPLNLARDEDGPWPDYKLLCFDIECKAGDDAAFPAAENPEDLVIQISCLLYSLATQRLEHTLLFSLGSCDSDDPAVTVLEFDSEFELLLAFVTFLKQYAPEFATGYNIINFDWAFVHTKLTAVYGLALDGYGRFNRGGQFRVYDAGQNSFQKRSKVKINGLVSLDMYAVAADKLKLPSYKLNAVAEEALGERKLDLDYKDIPRYYAAGPRERGVIGRYCVQDSALVGKLFFKFLPHLELSAVARLANITLARAIYDGQQIRVFTCLLKLAGSRGFVLPDKRRDIADEDDGGGYQGAKVLEPDSGFHVDPVLVLDFASLYPSIIQAHNLCFTTLALARPAGLREDEFSAFEVNGERLYFVHAGVRESLLSILLRDWLAMRKAIRARIPTSAPEEAVLLDKQQAAIKVVCNSVYGFTGVANGLLPCLPVAATVTTIGRDMLVATRDYVQTRWATRELLERDLPARPPAGEYAVRVVYGDTDSVFIRFSGIAYDDVCELGELMAARITRDLFRPPIKLECEKTFRRLLLITKKKYIGVINGGKMLMKGVDLVRKNNCAFINAYARRLVDLLFGDEAVSAAAAAIARAPAARWLERPLPRGFAAFGRVLAEAHARVAGGAGLDVADFVMTAELSRPPDAYSNTRLPHLTVYHKLAMRHGEVPSVKERVSYVIIAPTPEAERDARAVRPGLAPGKLLVSDLAEDPAYVVAHGVPLNTEYYFSHLLSTLSVTFKALFGNDTKITERLLKRFIPETAPGDAPFEHEAFAPLTGEGGESLQTLRTIFCTPTAAPRRS
ncbi:polymerase catalytic subunit [Suid alphaherpesvirus 1]|nr:polymerase catalytic subunit [Suid alphaherpesvirus 1]